MSGTMKNNIILRGTAAAWVFLFSEDSGNVEGLIPLYKFDNLQSAQVVSTVAGAATTAGGNTLDINRGDSAIIRFNLDNVVIDGSDETEIASEDGGADASGKGTITLVTNEAPKDFTSMTAFLADLKANKDSKVLVIVPSGYSFSRMGTGASAKPDGYIYGIGKLTSDLDITFNNSAIAPSLSFALQKHTTYTGDLTSAATPHPFDNQGIEIKRGGSNIPAASTIPLKLTSAQQTALMAGEMVYIENPAA